MANFTKVGKVTIQWIALSGFRTIHPSTENIWSYLPAIRQQVNLAIRAGKLVRVSARGKVLGTDECHS